MSDDEDDIEQRGRCGAVEVLPELPPEIRAVAWTNNVRPAELRIIGPIDDDVAADIDRRLRRAVASGQPQVVVDIHSDGGSVYAALKIVDLLDACPLPVITAVKGNAQSAAAVIFAAGDRRVLSPHAMVMLHSVRGGYADTLLDLQVDLTETKRINRLLCGVLARTTPRKSAASFERLMEANIDVHYSPDEALREGLATEIGTVTMRTAVTVATAVEVRRATPAARQKRKRLAGGLR